ncbi:MAG: alpha/beta fold hydrolase [Lachnospiraceae bacterium]|nr:alpha/beta fold hydrolase [Lachnospiraceae bacterium]
MTRFKGRFISILMASALVFSFPASVYAEEAEAETEAVTEAADSEAESAAEEESSAIEVAVASSTRDGVEIPAYITLPENYDAEGSYPFVIMIHGHGGNHNEWGGYDAISDGLAASGVIVATLDFSGCGNSTESFQLNTMTNMKADVADVISYVLETYSVDESKIGAFGYSMGGRIVLEMILEETCSFATIELVAPAEDNEDLKNLFGGAEAWEEMKAAAQENGYVDFTTVYGQEQELSIEWFEDLEKYDGLAEQAAEKYTGNSLVIWATDDAAVSPSVSEEVAAILGSSIVNTYADGHSYSFYGSDDYTVSAVNSASVNYFVNEFFANMGATDGYVRDITEDGSLILTVTADELLESGYAYGDELTVMIDGTDYTVVFSEAAVDGEATDDGEAADGSETAVDSEAADDGEDAGGTEKLALYAEDGLLVLTSISGDFAADNGIAVNETAEDGSVEWYYSDPAAIPVTVSIQ